MDRPDGDKEQHAAAAHWFARLSVKPVARETLAAFFQWRRLPGNAEAFRLVGKNQPVRVDRLDAAASAVTDPPIDARQRARQAEAAQWLAQLQSTPVARSTISDFLAWRSDGQNAEAFRHAERLWSSAAGVGDRPAIKGALRSAMTQDADRSRWWRRPALQAVAAALILFMAGGAVLLRLPFDAPSYVTAVGERRMFALADGSTVQLDTDSRVSVHYTIFSRALTLEQGQAFFTVAHESRRRFVVTAGDTMVIATGTRFDVRRNDGSVAVTLIQGGVDVRVSQHDPVRLFSGQEMVHRSGDTPVIRPVSGGAATAWTSGRIIFDDTPLAEAIAEMNRYTKTAVRLRAPSYAAAHVSGSFETGDVGSFVQAATAVLPLSAEKRANGQTDLVARSVTPIENNTPAF
jgi:transmembrane sensor